MRNINYPKGTFIISIDFELQFGLASANVSREYKNAVKQKGPSLVDSLVSLFEKYDTPATWGVVGKIFSEKEVIQRIRSSEVKHDIGSHSYSHINFLKSDNNDVKKDLLELVEAAKSHDLILKSFLFPWNKVGKLDMLAEKGFITFRGKAPLSRRIALRSTEFSRSSNLHKRLILLSRGLIEPVKTQEGLWNIAGSMTLKKHLSTDVVVDIVKKEMDDAVKSKKIFHFYFHVHDFLHPSAFWTTKERLEGLEHILWYADEKRKEGLQVVTMRDLAEYLSKKQ